MNFPVLTQTASNKHHINQVNKTEICFTTQLQTASSVSYVNENCKSQCVSHATNSYFHIEIQVPTCNSSRSTGSSSSTLTRDASSTAGTCRTGGSRSSSSSRCPGRSRCTIRTGQSCSSSTSLWTRL